MEENLLLQLNNKLGITYLRPYQELIITHIMENEERNKKTKLLAVLPTSSGKSLCFMAPIALTCGLTICVYPLLSLMKDQERRFKECGIKATIIKGGMDKTKRKELINSLLKNEDQVLITNPEMLSFLLSNGTLRLFINRVKIFVIDEAHTAVTWRDFRESYKKLGAIIKYLNPQHLLAFTATMDEEIAQGLKTDIFLNEIPYLVKASSDRENIFYHSVKTLSVISDVIKIVSDKKNLPSVVFCASRKKSEEIASTLKKKHFSVQYYHAGLDKSTRESIEEWFYHSTNGILVSTNAYGMGVSKNNIRSVIHTYIPLSAVSFLQESGRGGRDGDRAESYILSLINSSSPLKNIFLGKDCIRLSLLREMNEEICDTGCSMCSNCTQDFYSPYGLKKILRLLYLFPFSKKERIELYCSSFFPLLLPFHLSRINYEKALKVLVEEEYIKEKHGYYRLTDKGKKELRN